DLVRVDGRAPELFDLANRDLRPIEVREEEREAPERRRRIARRGAREQHDVGRLLRVRVPDLAPLDHVPVAMKLGACLHARRLGARAAGPAARRERLDDLPGILGLAVLLEPVVEREAPRERRGLLADQFLLLGQGEIHRGSSGAGKEHRPARRFYTATGPLSPSGRLWAPGG